MPSDSEEIESEARGILGAKYLSVRGEFIPLPEDVPYGPKFKKFKAVVFSIDIRNSSSYLTAGDTNSGKLHKAFLRVCARTVNFFGGDIRSFNGDGLLAFWKAEYQENMTPAVQAAMGIKWLLTEKLKDLFIEKYSFNFGIGLSWGDISAFRAGVEYVQGGSDLIFLDRSINEAVVIAKQAGAPDHIECTMDFFNNLEKQALIGSDGNPMWRRGLVRWKNGDFESRLTSYQWMF